VDAHGDESVPTDQKVPLTTAGDGNGSRHQQNEQSRSLRWSCSVALAHVEGKRLAIGRHRSGRVLLA
jgi:hypothetical protein